MLRKQWLEEPCGHASTFTILNEEKPIFYSLNAIEDPDEDNWMGDFKLSSIYRAGLELDHEYDLGTTTTSRITFLSEGISKISNRKSRLLALNNKPKFLCCGDNSQCKRKATIVNIFNLLWYL